VTLGASAELRSVRLPLAAKVATARGEIVERSGFVVCVRGEDGVCGVGEALPLPSFGGETEAECGKALIEALGELASCAAAGARGSQALDRALARTPVAQCACELALLDLAARRAGAPLAALLGARSGARTARVEVNALVSSRDPEACAEQARDAARDGFRTVKLKLGALPLRADLARARAVRESLGDTARLRLDANGAWDEATAADALDALAALDPEWVEQPIPPGDVAALARLRARSPVRIAADESLVLAGEAESIIDAGAVDALALKLPPLGGPRRALDLARRARERGIVCYVTSFLDSSLGVRAAAHAALALEVIAGASLPACGLATASLLSRDLARPLPVVDGALELDLSRPGIGADLDVAATAERIAQRDAERR